MNIQDCLIPYCIWVCIITAYLYLTWSLPLITKSNISIFHQKYETLLFTIHAECSHPNLSKKILPFAADTIRESCSKINLIMAFMFQLPIPWLILWYVKYEESLYCWLLKICIENMRLEYVISLFLTEVENINIHHKILSKLYVKNPQSSEHLISIIWSNDQFWNDAILLFWLIPLNPTCSFMIPNLKLNSKPNVLRWSLAQITIELGRKGIGLQNWLQTKLLDLYIIFVTSSTFLNWGLISKELKYIWSCLCIK